MTDKAARIGDACEDCGAEIEVYVRPLYEEEGVGMRLQGMCPVCDNPQTPWQIAPK